MLVSLQHVLGIGNVFGQRASWGKFSPWRTEAFNSQNL